MANTEVAGDVYTLDDYITDLRRIAAEAPDEDALFRELAPLAQRVALDRDWLEEKHYQADEEQGFGAFLLHEEPDHTLSVFVANWLPGRGAPPHDHGTWAVIAGVDGVEENVRYKRLDDRSDPTHGELEVKDRCEAGPGHVICIRDGGIHSVSNPGERMSVSLHTYGKHILHAERAQYDPETKRRFPFEVKVHE